MGACLETVLLGMQVLGDKCFVNGTFRRKDNSTVVETLQPFA